MPSFVPPLPPAAPPPAPQPPQPPNYMGWVLLVHLGVVLLLHLGRQLVDDHAGIFVVLFLIAALDAVAFFVLLVTGRWRVGLGFMLSGLLLFIIGFGDCLTHLSLGSMH